MHEGTSATYDSFLRSAEAIAELIDEVRDVLGGLRALRSLDSQADRAVTAVLAVPEVNRVKLGWELLEILSEGSGWDSAAILAAHIPVSDLRLAREALWVETEED